MLTWTCRSFKTLERSYLLKLDGEIAERPQQMLMRVSVGIHKDDIDAALETYNLLSEKWFIHASPTLFNAGAWSRSNAAHIPHNLCRLQARQSRSAPRAS